jgi:hypothetical protein
LAKGERQVGHRLESARGILFQASRHDAAEVAGHVLAEGQPRRRIGVQYLCDRVRGGRPRKRPFAGRDLEQDAPEGEHVGSAVASCPARLLGRHVGRRTDHHALGRLRGERRARG